MKKNFLLLAGGIIVFLIIFNFVIQNRNAEIYIDKGSAKAADKKESVFLNVSYEDCIDECKNFKNNSNKMVYCQTICELPSSQNITTADNKNCNEKPGIEKDYCWKNKALLEKRFELCERIAETRLKKICKNSVMKNFIEGIASQKEK